MFQNLTCTPQSFEIFVLYRGQVHHARQTSIEGMYPVTDAQFYLNSGDVRFVDMKHEEVERRQSKRSQQLPTNKLHKLDTKQIESLKKSCWGPM